MDIGLKGKVAMVAGASRGLGYAVAKALADEGAHVSIASRDEAAIRAAAQRIGGNVLALPVDVRSADAIREWASAIEKKFGGIDLLFTNSGGPPAGATLSFDDRAWQDAGGAAAVQHDSDDPCGRAVTCRSAAAARSSSPHRRR